MSGASVIKNQDREVLRKKLRELKQKSGNHSPSIKYLKRELPDLKINIDACFLSNPYATELFMEYFEREIVSENRLRDLLEFYPSQNNNIADALGKFFGIDPGSIFIGNGAIEVIQAVLHYFTKSKIVVNIPTFSSYHDFIRPGVELVYYQLDKEKNFKLDADEYVKFVKKHKPDTVVLINPNNPDGGYIRGEDIYTIVSQLDFVEQIIIDESFIHFAYEDDTFQLNSSYKMLERFSNVIIVKSLSKDFGIAGIRAGYGIMQADKVKQLLQYGYLWNSNGIAEYFFELYCRKDFADKYNEVRVEYIKDSLDFFKAAKTLKTFKSYPGYANFVLLEIINGESDFDMFSRLLIDNGIYVRACKDKIGLNGEFIRVSSRTKAENNLIIEALKSL